jgi:hypothetical protein
MLGEPQNAYYVDRLHKSFFSRFKTELPKGRAFTSLEDALTDISNSLESNTSNSKAFGFGQQKPAQFWKSYCQNHYLNL